MSSDEIKIEGIKQKDRFEQYKKYANGQEDQAAKESSNKIAKGKMKNGKIVTIKQNSELLTSKVNHLFQK